MNTEKINKAFATSLYIDPDKITDTLAYNTIPEWDSIAHMVLIAEIELIFDIMMDTDDIINLSSVGKAKEILSARYGIAF